jgi:hypothetical protein
LKKISKKSKTKIKFAKISIDKKKLTGSMSEMRNSVTCLPLLFLGKNISKSSHVMGFFSTMVEITRIITSHEINKDQVSYLQSLIKDYFHYRKKAFPKAKLTPKHHYNVHYPDLIIKFGPLLRTWTIMFESKHKYFKYVIEICKNFINITKLLAIRHQMLQASLKNDRFPRTAVINISEPNKTFLGELPAGFSTWSSKVKIHNTKFLVGDHIIVASEEMSNIKLIKVQNIFIN